MVDLAPEFESRDNFGTTSSFVSTVGTTAINVPGAASGRISEFYIHNPASNSASTIIQFSIDGGTNYHSLPWNSAITWTPKGNVTQIKIKANAASKNYEALLNIEAT
jgi:hypothetical protein